MNHIDVLLFICVSVDTDQLWLETRLQIPSLKPSMKPHVWLHFLRSLVHYVHFYNGKQQIVPFQNLCESR